MDLYDNEFEATRKKSADKMFEELGYKKYESEIKIQYIREGLDRIEFDKRNRLIQMYIWNDGAYPLVKSISNVELKAINKKVEELGW